MARYYGALLASRQEAAQFDIYGPSPFLRCEHCKTGDHQKCNNRAKDPDSSRITDCYCRYMRHKKKGER